MTASGTEDQPMIRRHTADAVVGRNHRNVQCFGQSQNFLTRLRNNSSTADPESGRFCLDKQFRCFSYQLLISANAIDRAILIRREGLEFKGLIFQDLSGEIQMNGTGRAGQGTPEGFAHGLGDYFRLGHQFRPLG